MEDGTGTAAADFLAAGRRLFRRVGLLDVLPSARRVCDEANRSRGSFSWTFPRTASFERLLIDRLLRSEERVQLMEAVERRALGAEARIRVDPDADMTTVLARIAAASFTANFIRDGESFGDLILVIALARRDESEVGMQARAAVVGFFEEMTEHQVAAYEVVLSGWGRTLRPPMTVDALARVLAAVSHGLALRWLVDGDEQCVTLFEDTVRCLLAATCAPPGDAADLDDVFRATLRVDPDQAPTNG